MLEFTASYRTTSFCLNLAAEQEKTVTEEWLNELKTGVINAQKCEEDCKYIGGLVSNQYFTASLVYTILRLYYMSISILNYNKQTWV